MIDRPKPSRAHLKAALIAADAALDALHTRERALRKRERQHASVARLGQHALSDVPLGELLEDAVARVAEALEVEYVQVLELLPGGQALSLRAGVGWRAGLVGQATVDAGSASQAGHTLLCDGPVIVEDLPAERRFAAPPLLVEHGVASGLNVVIHGRERPFGVLGAHTAHQRAFTNDDVHFLQSVANVLAQAIERRAVESALRESEARFGALHELAVAAGGVLDPIALGKLATRRACELLEVDDAVVYRWDTDQQVLAPVAACSSKGPLAPFNMRPDQGLTGLTFTRREPVVVQDYPVQEFVSPPIAARGVHSAVAAPLLAGDRAVGVLVVASRSQRSFSSNDIRLLSLLAAQLAPALEAAWLHAEVERRRSEAEALAELARQGATERDAAVVAALICERACRLLGADYAGIHVVDPDGRHRWAAMWGNNTEAWRTGIRGHARGLGSRAIASGRTIIEDVPDDTESDTPGRTHRAEGARTVLATPLVHSSGAFGALELGWRTDVRPGPSQVRLAEALAGYASTILENARAHARIADLGRQAAELAADLDAVLRQLPSGVIVVDGEGRLKLMNDAARRLCSHCLDCSRPVVPQLAANLLRPAPGTSFSPESSPLGRALQGITVERCECLARDPASGAETWLLTSAAPLRDESNVVVGAAMVFSDVTRERALVHERERAERAIRDSERRLADLVARLLVTQEDERRHVAYEIHDGLAQLAAAAQQHLEIFAARYRPRSPEPGQRLERALKLARGVVVEARRVIAGLRPTVLDDFGLAAALRMEVQALRDEGWEATLDDRLGEERLPTAVETALYRVAQEALANARKHAETRQVRVSLQRLSGGVRLEVRDWGRGFQPTAMASGPGPGERLGLTSMSERARLVGGVVLVRSRPARGTTVLARVPLANDR